MRYALAADAVMLIHFSFIAFALLGSLLLLKWPKLIWVHLPALAWGIYIETSGNLCPLTTIEITRVAVDLGRTHSFPDTVLGSVPVSGATLVKDDLVQAVERNAQRPRGFNLADPHRLQVLPRGGFRRLESPDPDEAPTCRAA